MVAIITDTLKKALLDKLYESVQGDSDTYYIAIGRSEPWNDSDVAVTPYNTSLDIRDFRLRMQSLKIAEDVSYVVPRNNWTSGTIYSQYDENVVSHPDTPYFVITDENNVYACVQRARNSDGTLKASTVKPTGTSTSYLTTADGYVWKYLYSISTADSFKYLSANYMPVQYIDSASDVNESLQKAVQDAAVSGQILSISITNGGTGYTSAPAITIEGNGTGAYATATVSGGQVKRITMVSRGSGYDYAKVNISGTGSGATARANIGQKDGFGANPIIDLKSKALMFNSKPAGLEGGSFIIGNDFRQIAIIKNPKDYSGNDFTSNSGLALRKLNVVNASGFAVNETVTGSVSGAQAIIDYIDSNDIYYHQNSETGYLTFDSDIGSTISITGYSSELVSITDSADVDFNSGEIIYLENRAAIIRSENQTEDIKTIIQL